MGHRALSIGLEHTGARANPEECLRRVLSLHLWNLGLDKIALTWVEGVEHIAKQDPYTF